MASDAGLAQHSKILQILYAKKKFQWQLNKNKITGPVASVKVPVGVTLRSTNI